MKTAEGNINYFELFTLQKNYIHLLKCTTTPLNSLVLLHELSSSQLWLILVQLQDNTSEKQHEETVKHNYAEAAFQNSIDSAILLIHQKFNKMWDTVAGVYWVDKSITILDVNCTYYL